MRRILPAGLCLVLAAAGAWLWLRPSSTAPDAPAAVPRSTGRYLNAAPGVAYVGREACAACHADAHASYLRTTHSRAFRTVDLEEAPPNGAYRHEASGLNYRIYRKDGHLRVAEDLPMQDGSRLVLADHAMSFVAGSGSHSVSYVLPLDGFLVEAPATWYTKTRRWGMSPGYDKADHDSFARGIDAECLFCHTGRTERLGRTTHRLRIEEDAIGCERCHGPGALHVEKWRSDAKPTGKTDLTIVNPLALEPAEQLDLCGQCHLDHTLSVPVRGRGVEAWRPGLPMGEYRTTYRLEASNARMSVVGHVDQLRKSRCFQASGTMSCLTCHDPHNAPPEGEAKAYFRDRCLQCHGEDACGVGHADPRRRAEQDDCSACHMPRSSTDIPHFSFTHHRIAVHKESDDVVDVNRVHTLVPSGDVSHLPPADRDRGLGLAYLKLTVRRPDDPTATHTPAHVIGAYLVRARELLEKALAGGAADAVLESSLAFVYEQAGDPVQAEKYALAALDRGAEADVGARVRALDVLAAMYAKLGQHAGSVRVLGELVKMRRNADDWGRLAAAQVALRDRHAAHASALRAAEIAPHRPEVQRLLAKTYELLGNAERSRHHERIAARLEERRRAP